MIPLLMRLDYPLFDINPVFPGLGGIIIIIIVIIIIFNVIIIIIIIINYCYWANTHKTILENTVKIETHPVALHFKNFSQYSSRSK